MAQALEAAMTEQEDTQHGRFLTFVLGDEVYGIEIRYVKEIIGLMPVTKLPEAPGHIKGIINLRGKIIPVIDVRLKFKEDAVAYSDRTCIIVIETDELTAGLIVDNVAEVVSIDDESIVPPPDYGSSYASRYISGIGKTGDEVKILLDCEKLFLEDEKQAIMNI
jgi:purine-binding chemotaxis protein CheW